MRPLSDDNIARALTTDQEMTVAIQAPLVVPGVLALPEQIRLAPEGVPNRGNEDKLTFCFQSALRDWQLPYLSAHLPMLIQNSYELRTLLEQLNAAQRSELWTAVQDRLPALIEECTAACSIL